MNKIIIRLKADIDLYYSSCLTESTPRFSYKEHPVNAIYVNNPPLV